MPLVAFIGCDGAGKSAVIRGVTECLQGSGRRVTHGHWMPRAIARSAASEEVTDNPHGEEPRGFVGSTLKLGWLWLNWWLAWLRFLRRDTRNGFVLFDRYHADLLVDPRRYRYGGPMWLARVASRWMPQPDTVVFLDAPPSVLLLRKQEVSGAALARSRSNYLAFGKHCPRFRLIDATQPLDQVISEAMGLLVPPGSTGVASSNI